MKAFAGLGLSLLLVACGEPNAVLPAPVGQVGGDTGQPSADTKPLPPEVTAEVQYIHQPMIGRLADQADPADLDSLAEKAMTCGSEVFPSEYFNEPRALQLGRASQNGNELKVGGQTHVDFGPVLVDGVERTHDDAFAYVGVLKRFDLDVVYVRQPEDEEYQIIDASTATAVNINGLPIASPSGRALIAFAGDAMNFVGIEIVERDSAGLKLVRKFDTATYPCGLQWLSDTRATFLEIKPGAIHTPSLGDWDARERKYFGPASIELRNGEWIYTPAKD